MEEGIRGINTNGKKYNKNLKIICSANKRISDDRLECPHFEPVTKNGYRQC